MEKDKAYIYWIMLEERHKYAVCVREQCAKSQTATDWNFSKGNRSFIQTPHLWYRSLDKRYTFLHAKFEVGLSIPFTRIVMSKKSDTFPWGMLPFSKI
jgi:hypothetical protein